MMVIEVQMNRIASPIGIVLIVLLALQAISWEYRDQARLPEFGRDTVLVWKTKNQSHATTFVVRIAEFRPNRFIEWENATTQGTVLMTRQAVTDAEDFISSRLFEAGKDNRVEKKMTIWLSQHIYRELREKEEIKVKIDSMPARMEVIGEGQLTVSVNRSARRIPILKVRDSRGAERWFINSESNPLMVKHIFRGYTQTLSSITTDKSNTLRWIKGKKLNIPGSTD
jgi:hypothetical protein